MGIKRGFPPYGVWLTTRKKEESPMPFEPNDIYAIIKDEVNRMVKEIVEKLLLEEREEYLQKHPEDKGNGYYKRGLITRFGNIDDLKVPRVREGDFRPKIIPERRRASMDLGDVILSLFASGCSVRNISRFIETVYGAYYSPASISRLTDITTQEIEKWRNRQVKEQYFALYVDATFLNIRRGSVEKEPVYVVVGLDWDGTREVLGFWLFGSEGESASNWQDALVELKSRGLKRVELFIADGLKGLEEAVLREFPGSKFQLCVLHAVKGSLKKVRKRNREAVAESLKAIYRASSREEARKALLELKAQWAKTYPEVVEKWEENFNNLTTFMQYPKGIRQFIYTTNQLERLMKEIKRRTKVIEVFSGPESAYKVVYLVLSQMNERYGRKSLPGFKEAMAKFRKASSHSDTLD
jgi:putative transposase